MAKLPDNVADNGWDTPDPGEAADRVNQMLARQGAEAPEEPEEADETPAETEPGDGDTPAGTARTPEPTDKETKGGKADRAGGEATPDDEDDRVFEIDGERLTADEIRQLRLGAMRQADYTRKTQALAEARRQEDERFRQIFEQNQAIMTHLLRQSGATIDPTTGLPVEGEAGEPLDPRIAARLEEQNQRLVSMAEERQRERDEADQRAFTDFIASNFDRSLDALFKKHGVTDDRERERFRLAIIGANPDGADPRTGEVTPQSIYDATRREFLKLHHDATKKTRAEVDKTLAGMRPNKPKAPVVAPAQSQTPRQDVGLLKAQRKGQMPDWDSAGNTTQFLRRMAESGNREE